MSSSSLHEQNIFDFVTVIEQYPDLLTPQIKSSLEDLIKILPNDLIEISNQVTLWFEKYDTIENKMNEVRKDNASVKGMARRPTASTPESAIKLIENAVRDSSKPQPNNPQP